MKDIFPILQVVAPSGMMFSKDLYNRNGPFDVESFGWFSEDLDWVSRALMAGTFCICVKQRLYLYRRHAHNLTNKAANSFRSWLKLYSQTFREARRDPEFEALARGIIRSRSVRFLPTCSTSEGRLLLKQAIETLAGDLPIRVFYFMSYFGLVSLLKLLKQARQFSRRIFRKRLAIPLSVFHGGLWGSKK